MSVRVQDEGKQRGALGCRSQCHEVRVGLLRKHVPELFSSSPRPPESPLGGWFLKSGIFWFSVRPIFGETCPNCTWPSLNFRKFVWTLVTGLLQVQNVFGLQDLASESSKILYKWFK